MRALLLLLPLLLACGPAGGGSGSVADTDSTVTVKDAPETLPLIAGLGATHPGIDLLEVSYSSDGQRLRITAVCDRDPLAHARAHREQTCDPIEVSIDSDANEETGGENFGFRKGYELGIRIAVGVRYPGKPFDGGWWFAARHDGPERARTIEGFAISHSIVRFGKKRAPVRDYIHDDAMAATRVDGKRIVVELPYALLGLNSGQKIRLSTYEVYAGRTPGAGKSYLDDATLELR